MRSATVALSLAGVFLVTIVRPPALPAQNELGFALAVGAGAAVGLVALIDIGAAPGSARKYNRTALGAAPWIDPVEGRVGIAFSVGARGQSNLSQPIRVDYAVQLPGNLKSESTALLWSLGATLGPAALGLGLASAGGWNDNQGTLGVGLAVASAGVLMGPSVGHWYAEQYGRGVLSMFLRIGIAGLGLLALSTAEFD